MSKISPAKQLARLQALNINHIHHGPMLDLAAVVANLPAKRKLGEPVGQAWFAFFDKQRNSWRVEWMSYSATRNALGELLEKTRPFGNRTDALCFVRNAMHAEMADLLAAMDLEIYASTGRADDHVVNKKVPRVGAQTAESAKPAPAPAKTAKPAGEPVKPSKAPKAAKAAPAPEPAPAKMAERPAKKPKPASPAVKAKADKIEAMADAKRKQAAKQAVGRHMPAAPVVDDDEV